MRQLVYETSREAFLGVITAFVENEDGIVEDQSGIRTWGQDITVAIRKPDILTDFSLVGFTPRRWERFLGHYFDAYDFSLFYQKALHGKIGQIPGYTCEHNAQHTSGGCLFGVSVRRFPLTVVLHSRSCVWAPTGLLDIGFASALALDLQRESGLDRCQVIWHIDRLQMHSIKSLIVLQKMGLLDPIIAGRYDHSPFSQMVHKEMDILPRTRDSPYRTYRRYAGKLDLLAKGIEPQPSYPYIPRDFKESALAGQDDSLVSILDVANEIGVSFEHVNKSARQMGLLSPRDGDLGYPRNSPKIAKLIKIMQARYPVLD